MNPVRFVYVLVFFVSIYQRTTEGTLRDNFILVGDSGNASYGLFQIDIQTGNTTQILSEVPTSVVGVAYDPVGHNFYYSDVGRRRICKYSPLTKNHSIVYQESSEGSFIGGLAYDYVNRKLYYTDTRAVAILGLLLYFEGSVREIDVESKNHRILIDRNRRIRPVAIQVDMINRTLYFTDWDKEPGIYKVNLIEPSHKLIVSTDLYMPYGLTIDFRENKMYWANVKPPQFLSRVEVANLDGSERRTLLEEYHAHYYGMSMDSTYIYLTDWNYNKVRRIHKSAGTVSNVSSTKIFGKLYGIRVYVSALESEQLQYAMSSKPVFPVINSPRSTAHRVSSTIHPFSKINTTSILPNTGKTSLDASSPNANRLNYVEDTYSSSTPPLNAPIQATNNPGLISAAVIVVAIIIASAVYFVMRYKRIRKPTVSRGILPRPPLLSVSYNNDEYDSCACIPSHNTSKSDSHEGWQYQKLD